MPIFSLLLASLPYLLHSQSLYNSALCLCTSNNCTNCLGSYFYINPNANYNAKYATTDAQPAQPVSPTRLDSRKTPALSQPQLLPAQHINNAQYFAASA